MEVAFKRRNISNRIDITLSFLQNGVNGRILRTIGIVLTVRTAYVAVGVLCAMEVAFKRRNISKTSEITLRFRQDRVYVRILRTVGLVSSLKTACVAIGV